jgi:4-amino-4-deoxy-L-arabinose transferase-like glycosyltransferase
MRVTTKADTERLRVPLTPLMALLLWTGFLLLVRSPQQSFLAHDEGYYAQQARWILANQDWLTVGWWGDIVFDRTIALQWLIAISYRLFGWSETAARIPSGLASLGAVVLTWRLGTRFWDHRVGWWGAAILAVTPIWAQASRLAMQDIVLVFLELLGIWALLRAEETSRRWGWGLLAGAAVGLGFFVKSVMMVLPVVALMPYLIQRWRIHLTNPGLYGGLILGFIPPGIWLGLSLQQYGWLPLQQLLGKVLRLSQVSQGSGAFYPTTPFFYVWNIPANGFPWVFFAIAGFIMAWRSPHLQRRWLWLGYPLILLAALMAFDTRTWYYPLQLHPFLALFAGLTLTRLTERYVALAKPQRRLPLLLTNILSGVAVVLLVAGLVLLTGPVWGLDPDLGAYGWLGLAGGIGWLVPGWVMIRDRNTRWHRRGELWQLGWLLGPALVITALFTTGLWGNYSTDVKTALNSPPLADILANPVHFIQPGAGVTAVLLTNYTPHLGQRFNNPADIPPETYAWAPGVEAPEGFTQIATVRDWQLVLKDGLTDQEGE